MADFKILGNPDPVPVNELGKMTQGIGYPLRSVDEDSAPVSGMPTAPINQYSVAIGNQWVNAAQVSGNPVYNYVEVAVPSDGQITVNNTDLSLVTEITISKIGLNGSDFTAVYEKLGLRNVISISDFLDNTNFLIADVTGPAINNPTTFTVPVSVRDSNGSLTVGELTSFSLIAFAPVIPPRIISIVASGKDPDGGDYLGFGSELQGNKASYTVPFNGVVNTISIGRTDTDDVTLQVRINNSVVKELFTTNRETLFSSQNIVMNAGDRLEVRVKNSSNKINDPVVALILEEI